VTCTYESGVVFVSCRDVVSASQPLALTPAMSPQSPVVGVTDTLTTTNDTGTQEDRAELEPMLEDLRQFITGMDLKLEEGWEVIIKHRPSNPLVTDKIYISPDGHKFRSRLQVARFLENPKPKTNAYSVAQRTNVHPSAQRVRCGYALLMSMLSSNSYCLLHVIFLTPWK
jgi:hypothetical protein